MVYTTRITKYVTVLRLGVRLWELTDQWDGKDIFTPVLSDIFDGEMSVLTCSPMVLHEFT